MVADLDTNSGTFLNHAVSAGGKKLRLPHKLMSSRENSVKVVPYGRYIPYAYSEAKRHPIPHIWHRPPIADIFFL